MARLKLTNMTSTELYRVQVASTMGRIRHENTNNTAVTFQPTQLGGIFGQREILEGVAVMRQYTIGQ
jgi:hypothetical protein